MRKTLDGCTAGPATSTCMGKERQAVKITSVVGTDASVRNLAIHHSATAGSATTNCNTNGNVNGTATRTAIRLT